MSWTAALVDLRQHADAAHQVLVHGVVVIHVELHHRHDLAEGAHELAEHAGFVHPPQHGFRIVLGREDFQEQLVGFRIGAQLGVDELERSRHRAHGVRMERQIVLLRETEDADQVDGIAAEHAAVGDGDAVLVDDEVVAAGELHALDRAQARHHAAQHRHALGVAVLQLGTQDGGQVADVLGDQKIMFHEALDVLLARVLGVTEPHRDLALDVEGQPLFGAAGDEMHVATHRPEEILAAAEQLVFLLVEYAALDQLVRLAHAVDVFGDPEQGVQIAQAALAVLDVGLDQIARLPAATDAVLALGELGGGELPGGVAHHLIVEARLQFVEQRAVAEQEARFQDGGADGHVRLGLADAFVDRAGGMADLEPGVPQAVEDGFSDQLTPGGLLVGQHEQQIDVRAGCLQPAAVAAGGDHRHVLGFGRVLRRIEMLARELEQDADDLVFHPAQPLGAAAAVAVFQQQLLGLVAALVERCLQPLRDASAQFALAADMGLGEFFEIRDDGAGIDQVAGVPGGRCRRRVRARFEGEGGHDAIRIAEAGAEVTGWQRYSGAG